MATSSSTYPSALPGYALSGLSDSQLYRYVSQDDDREYAQRLPLSVRHWDMDLILWLLVQDARDDVGAHKIRVELIRACRGEGRCFKLLFSRAVMDAINEGTFGVTNVPLGMRVAKLTFVLAMAERIRLDEADDVYVLRLNEALAASKREADAREELERSARALRASVAAMRAMPSLPQDAWELPSVVPRVYRRRIKVIFVDDEPRPSHKERRLMRAAKRSQRTRGKVRAALVKIAELKRRIYTRVRNAANLRRAAEAARVTAAHVARCTMASVKGAAWTMSNYVGRFTRAMMSATSVMRETLPQSGLSAREARVKRDSAQRDAAKKKQRAAYKATPKDERAAKIKAERDKRSGVIQAESGRVLPALAGAVGATLLQKVWSVLTKSERVLTNVEAFMRAFKKGVRLIKEHVGQALWIAPLVLLAHRMISTGEFSSKLAVVTIVGCLSKAAGPALWKHIAEFFPRDGVLEQSGLADVSAKLLAVVMTFTALRGKMNASAVTDLMRRLSIMGRASSGLVEFFDWVSRAIECCVNGVRKLFGKDAIQLYDDSEKPLRDWMKRVDDVALSISICEEDPSPALLNKLVQLMKDGDTFKNLYRGTPVAKRIDEVVVKVNSLLMPHTGALNARNNFRFEPDACLFLGEPGIGKTLLAVPLCATVLMRAGLVPAAKTFSEVASEIWQKGTSEFWNSYSGQACVVMDDAFQARTDASDKENEYMTLIRMCSSWSYPLNFADLSSKGKIFFQSKFIFGTTNVESIRSAAGICISEPAAVVRRINHAYRLKLKAEYKTNGFLDHCKYEQELKKCSCNRGLDHFPWYMWEVARHDFLTGVTSCETRPLKDAVQDMISSLRKKTDSHGATVAYLKGFVDSLREDDALTAQDADDSQSSDDVVPQAGRANSFMWKPCAATVIRTYQAYRKDLREDASRAQRFLRALTVGAKCALVVIGIELAVKTALRLLHAIFSGVASLFGSAQRNTYDGGKSPKVQSNRPITVPKKLKNTDIRLQAGDVNVINNVYANSYKLWYADKESNPVILGQVIFICDRLAVMPDHFNTVGLREKFDEGLIDDDTVLHFRNAVTNAHSFDIKYSAFKVMKQERMEKRDISFIVFNGVRAHRNISNAFLRQKELDYIGGAAARLDICEIDDRVRLREDFSRRVYVFPSVSVGKNLRYGTRVLEEYAMYKATTSHGDCGAPASLVDNSSYGGRTVFGIHVAGNEMRGVGYCALITFEMVKDAMSRNNIVVDNFLTDIVNHGVVAQCSYVLPPTHGGTFLPLVTIDKSVNTAVRTSYFPTELYGTFGEYEYLPAPLAPVFRQGTLVDPMENAVKSYSSALFLDVPEELEQAVHVAMSRLTSATRDHSRRVYTFEEAILGIPQQKFRSIPRGTSAGFPYIFDVKDGKKSFFGDGQDYDLTTPKAYELRQRVEYVEFSAQRGERCAHVFVDFLKDELRSKKKVEDVATRLISSAPLDYTVLWRMYFGAFSSAVMNNHTLSGMAPGICTYVDWDLLAELLKSKGDQVFAGDFKGFDASEQEPVLMALLRYVNRWYGDSVENQRVREVLWLDLVHSRHIGGPQGDRRHIYQWNKSLPSGHPFTTICNSMYSLVALVACYIRLTGDRTSFWSHVFTVTYGDDNVSNVDSQTASFFNQVTVASAMKSMFGLTYTSDKKDAELVETTVLENVSFLKRAFELGFDGWSCPLELDSFLYCVYWCKNKRKKDDIIKDELETALQELSLHDESVWNKWAPRVYRLLESRNVVPLCPCSYNEYRALVRSRADAWY